MIKIADSSDNNKSRAENFLFYPQPLGKSLQKSGLATAEIADQPQNNGFLAAAAA